MRKYQQKLMLVVTLLVIVSFIYFYSGTRNDQRSAADRAGNVYGRNVGTAQYQREARKFDICQGLLRDLWMVLIGEAQDIDQATDNFVWNTFVLRHEADALGIEASDDEVIEAIQKLPTFQTNGAYDSAKYTEFLQQIASRGFTGIQLEELVRDELRLTKLKALIGSTMASTPAEIRSLFEQRNQKTEASLVRFKMEEVAGAVQVSDEDVAKLYEERKDGLKSEELRKVRYVAFSLPKTDKPLDPKERVAQMSKLGDRAQEFALAMTNKEAKFEEVAAKFEVPVKETAEFSMEKPDAELAASPDIAGAVFEKLTTAEPNSEVLMTPTGYYVLQLSGVTPARPLTLEEAKADLAKQLKEERSQETLNLKVAEMRAKLDAELKAGKSFTEAATALGLKPETLPAFSMMEPPKDESGDARLIMSQTFDLAEGELSGPVPTATGMLLVHVDKRLPVDETKFEQEKTMITQAMARNKRDSAFALWLKDRRNAAKVASARS